MSQSPQFSREDRERWFHAVSFDNLAHHWAEYFHFFGWEDDVAQETRIKTWTTLDMYNDSQHMVRAARIIARNVTVSIMRREGVRGAPGSLDDAYTQGDAGIIAVQEHEKHETLRLCMDQLGSNQRFVLTEFYFSGRPYEEISKAIDISVDAVKKVAQRARESLRRCLQGRLGE